ncbi:MAG: hemolysin family protein [Bacteroidota bacterium]|nr:hemolysin family protein [Bacteroidota bacterium]
MDLIVIIVASLILSAFFSGVEIAYLTSNKLKIEMERKKGTLSAIILTRLIKKPSIFIGAMLIGNNISLVLYGSVMARILEPIFKVHLWPPFNSDFYVITFQTIVSTLIILVFAEFIPKVIFRINPNLTFSLLAFPIAIVFYTLYPIVFLITGFSELIIKVFSGIKTFDKEFSFGKVDLDNFIREYSSEEKEQEVRQEVKMFRNAMELSEVRVRECMIPRTEIIAVRQDESVEIIKNKFIETGLSKILVYDTTIDNIIGYVHVYDLFKSTPDSIKSITRNITIIPEAMPVGKLLSSFIHQSKGVAIVVDEFGGTSGMVTLEDVIEEIFGEIYDEYDIDKLTEQKINDSEYILSGRLEIDYINGKYNLGIPKTEDYETIAGFIYHHYESIPKVNDVITINQFTFIIKKATHNKIELVQLNIKQEE